MDEKAEAQLWFALSPRNWGRCFGVSLYSTEQEFSSTARGILSAMSHDQCNWTHLEPLHPRSSKSSGGDGPLAVSSTTPFLSGVWALVVVASRQFCILSVAESLTISTTDSPEGDIAGTE